MGEKRPKRRKAKDNPYTLVKIEGQHFLSFRDGQGVLQEITIAQELFNLMDRFELEDLSYLNAVDRHYEQSEQTEISLNLRAIDKPESVEDAVIRKLEYERLYQEISQLSDTQRRRLILYHFKGLTYQQIAKREGCTFQAVAKSVTAAEIRLKNILK